MRSRSDTAVCIVRAERQTDRLLITITISHDIAAELHSPPIHYSDARDAANAVAEFLLRFEEAGP